MAINNRHKNRVRKIIFDLAFWNLAKTNLKYLDNISKPSYPPSFFNEIVDHWIVKNENSGWTNNVFKLFLMMNFAGAVVAFSSALNRMGLYKLKSAVAGSPSLSPRGNSTRVFTIIFEVLRYIINAGVPQIKRLDWDPCLKLHFHFLNFPFSR